MYIVVEKTHTKNKTEIGESLTEMEVEYASQIDTESKAW